MRTIAALCLTLVGFSVAAAPANAAVPGTYSTSVVVANPGAADASVSLVFRRADGSPATARPTAFTVRPGASVLTYVPNISELADGRYSLEVESDRYVAVLTNLKAADVSASTAYTAVASAGGADKGRTLYAPYAYADNGGFMTAIVVRNTANAVANVAVNYISALGYAVTRESRVIPALGSTVFDQGSTAGLGTGFRSAFVTSDQDVTAVVFVTNPQIGQYGVYRAMGAVATSVYFPVIYAAYYGYATSFSVQNTGSLPATITTTYYDAVTGQSAGTEDSGGRVPRASDTTFAQYGLGSTRSILPAGFNGSAVATTSSSLPIVGVGTVSAAAFDNGGTTVSHFNANMEMYNALPATAASAGAMCTSILKNYYGFNTSLTVQNVDTSPTDLTLVYADATGRPVLTQSVPGLRPGTTYFNYTPGNVALADGFNGAVTVRSSGARIIGMVNELFGTGDQPGDQLFTYACDGGLAAAAGTYTAWAPIILKNAPIS